MTWQEIREHYPHRWLVVEAIGAYTVGKRRIIENLEIIGVFGDDWKEAWETYEFVHSINRCGEYYSLHTDREELDIRVMQNRVSPRFFSS
jgi:hypothetical protein